MGIYIFSGSVMAWLPPFVISFLNEIGASMAIGLASLNVFFAGGFLLLMRIGNYEEAVALSQNDSMTFGLQSMVAILPQMLRTRGSLG